MPPRIGDRVRAGQGHYENELGGQNYRECQRIADIQAAIDAIHSHLQRGDVSDGLVFDAVRIRLLEIGEAVKALPGNLLVTQPSIPWQQIARMREHIAHRYSDAADAILQATVHEDLGRAPGARNLRRSSLARSAAPSDAACSTRSAG